jgi:hypothetical protein
MHSVFCIFYFSAWMGFLYLCCMVEISLQYLTYTWLTDAASVVERVHGTRVVGAVQGGRVDIGGRFVGVGTARTVPSWGAVTSGLRQAVSITVLTT